MPRSMTGFATADGGMRGLRLKWELRSVNHRFLDIGLRLSDELKPLEPELRTRLGKVLKRGKVDCSLKLSQDNEEAKAPEIDTDKLNELKSLQQGILSAVPTAQPLAVADLLRWPGVLKEPQESVSELNSAALAAFDEALTALDDSRLREGRRIAELLRQRLDGIESLLVAIEPAISGASARYRDKLMERLQQLDVDAEPQRLEQELALIAQKLDITEEFDRLRAHIDEIRDVLGRDEPIGRHLDFLIQELNREANTLASKAQDEALAKQAVELKVLIEQMREQVQNLE
jgi:uncharacterized protein (TIGR00255 family)